MQKYLIANFDKKEYIEPVCLLLDGWESTTLVGITRKNNTVSRALLNMLANEWQGDRVLVISDTDSPQNTDKTCLKVATELCLEFNCINLYHYALCNFLNISYDRRDGIHFGCRTYYGRYRYVYNHELKQFIDLDAYPLDWEFYDCEDGSGWASIISPLTLLLSIGNGSDERDFHGRGKELVGSWCTTVQKLEVRETLIPDCKYKGLQPLFAWIPEEKTIPFKRTEPTLSFDAAKLWLRDNERRWLTDILTDPKSLDSLWLRIPREDWTYYENAAKSPSVAGMYYYQVVRRCKSLDAAFADADETIHYWPVFASSNKEAALSAAQAKLRQEVAQDEDLCNLLSDHSRLESVYQEAEREASEHPFFQYEGNCLDSNTARICLPDEGFGYIIVEAQVEAIKAESIDNEYIRVV